MLGGVLRPLGLEGLGESGSGAHERSHSQAFPFLVTVTFTLQHSETVLHVLSEPSHGRVQDMCLLRSSTRCFHTELPQDPEKAGWSALLSAANRSSSLKRGLLLDNLRNLTPLSSWGQSEFSFSPSQITAIAVLSTGCTGWKEGHLNGRDRGSKGSGAVSLLLSVSSARG